MNNTIYIGTAGVDDKFHIGMTSNNRSPYTRWKDDDYGGKLPYSVKKVRFYNVQNLRDEPVHQYILKDKNVYSVKSEEGIRSDEIFRVDSNNPKEYIVNLVEEALEYNKTGIRQINKYYQPRPHQAWVNACILDKFDGSETVIQPLNACARFGKTLGGLELFKSSGLKTMVIGSYWLSANQSFISTVEDKFDITSDITIIKPDYQQYVDALAKGNRVLIDLSLHTDEDKIDERLINELSKTSSLIYIDEADFGAWTSSSRDTSSRFIDSGNNLVVVATGTNIDRALIGSKTVEYPITVSYLDLIEGKRQQGYLFDETYSGKGENEVKLLSNIRSNPDMWVGRLDNIVEVGCVNLDASDDLTEHLNDLSEEKRPNMSKIFARRNTHIQREIVKNLLVNEDFGDDIFGFYATEYTSIENPAVMMFIPGTKSDVNNLVKVGQSIAPHYNWIALHGDDYTNRIAEKEVLDIITNSGKERTVIISCSMGSRSFSVPNIIAVVNCKDGGSVGTAVQQASRCFTPGCDKEVGLVVNYSFNSHKTSSFETDLISSALDKETLDTDSAIRRVYGLMNFFKKDCEGYLIKLSEADFLEYITSKDNLENMASAQVDMKGLISNIDLLSILEGVKTHNSTDKEWKGVIDKAKTYIETVKKSDSEVDENKKSIKDLIKKIHSIIKTSGNVYYMSPDSQTFRDCLEEISNNPSKNDEYVSLVGIDARIVLDNVCQFLPETFMDLIILKSSEFDSQDNFTFNSDDSPMHIFNI